MQGKAGNKHTAQFDIQTKSLQKVSEIFGRLNWAGKQVNAHTHELRQRIGKPAGRFPQDKHTIANVAKL